MWDNFKVFIIKRLSKVFLRRSNKSRFLKQKKIKLQGRWRIISNKLWTADICNAGRVEQYLLWISLNFCRSHTSNRWVDSRNFMQFPSKNWVANLIWERIIDNRSARKRLRGIPESTVVVGKSQDTHFES